MIQFLITEKFHALNEKLDLANKIKILRIYGRTHEREVYHDPCFNITLKRESNAAFDAEEKGRCLIKFQNDALHFKIRQANPDIIKKAKELNDLLQRKIIPSLEQRKKLVF